MMRSTRAAAHQRHACPRGRRALKDGGGNGAAEVELKKGRSCSRRLRSRGESRAGSDADERRASRGAPPAEAASEAEGRPGTEWWAAASAGVDG